MQVDTWEPSHTIWLGKWYSSLQPVIRVTIKFPPIFGETNSMEVLKIHEICEIYSPHKKEVLQYSKYVKLIEG